MRNFVDMVLLVAAFALAINAIYDGNYLLFFAYGAIVFCQIRLINYWSEMRDIIATLNAYQEALRIDRTRRAP